MAKTAAEHLESQRITQSPQGRWGWWGAVHTHALSFLPPSRASLSVSPRLYPPTIRVKSGLGSGAQPAGLMGPGSLELSPPGCCPVCTISTDSSVWTVLPGITQAMALRLGHPWGSVHELERVAVHFGPSVTPG